jgi:hypothetical protein
MLTQNAKASPKRKREEEPQQEIVVVGDKVESAVVPRVKKIAKKAMVNDATKEAKASKESP